MRLPRGWVLALLLAGCAASNPNATQPPQPSAAKSPQLKVAATFLPMYWFAKAVAGDKAEVTILVPPGTEIHEYQATPANVQSLAQADVLVKNGLGLEEFLDKTAQNASKTKIKQIDASTGIKTLETQSDSHSHSDKDRDHHGANPHVWLDPARAKQQVGNIRDGLIAADPNNKTAYEANAAAYIQQLDALDRQFKSALQPYRGCTYITFHDAYPYLADRYGLKQVAVLQTPEDSLSPASVQQVVKTAKQYKVKTLLGEPGSENNQVLQSLAKDLKVNLKALDALETGSLDPQYYFEAMKKNLQTLLAACR